MSANRLQLNAAKTELLWCASSRRAVQPSNDRVTICGSDILPASAVRDIGVWIDSGITMSTHISKVVAGCFATLRQLRSIHRCLTRETLIRLVVSLVLTRVDYCNSVLTGLPQSQLNRLQAVINAAARLILSGRRHDHITPLLLQLHWLRVPERIEFKLCVLVYRSLHGMASDYLASSFQRVSDVTTRRHLRSARTLQLIVPPTRCLTLGDRAFPVAAARAWNALPHSVSSAPSLSIFRRLLKTHLFRRSFYL